MAEMNEPSRAITRRCSICDISWHPSDQFEICASCGEPTALVGVIDGSEVLDMGQSSALRAEFVAAQNAELSAQIAADQAADAALQRRTSAAVAALEYDLDQWMTTEGADWIGG